MGLPSHKAYKSILQKKTKFRVTWITSIQTESDFKTVSEKWLQRDFQIRLEKFTEADFLYKI